MNLAAKCPVCNTIGKNIIEDGRDYFILNGNSPSFSISYCSTCLIGNSFPFLSDNELKIYYPENYEAYKPKKHFAGFLQTYKYKQDLKIIFRQCPIKHDLSIYEIGAGRGEFLYEAKKMGLTTKGIEPGKSGIEYAKNNFDIELQSGFASDIQFTKKYDIVVIRHVLEHINDFHHCLKAIFTSGLKIGGCLYLKLPCMSSWESYIFGKYWHGYDLPRHRVHFSKKGIIKLLSDLGFKNINVKPEVVPADIMRSILYYSKHGNSLTLKLCSKAFCILPNILQMCLGQIVGILLRPLTSGRMIVTAIKE